MSRWYSYLNSTKEILGQYRGTEPFHIFLKHYFSQHKKFGSRDRKMVAHHCYAFFRMGKALPEERVEEKILLALFLGSTTSDELLDALRPAWNEKTHLPLREKLAITGNPLGIGDIFPWKHELSAGINYEVFSGSHLIQPDLFLRLRPGRKNTVLKKLEEAGVPFEILSGHSLSLPNKSSIDKVIELNCDAVVQDLSSQKTGDFLLPLRKGYPLKIWDCCAASGGKSIMAKDILQQVELTVSDVRSSILVNLEKRFSEAGITRYKILEADLSANLPEGLPGNFDLVIADLPCTGSGTWSRTPEQLYYFDPAKIEEYASLQTKILSNVVHAVAPGGYILYSTCSVFKRENEDQVSMIMKKFNFETRDMRLIEGYTRKADTLFASLLQKPL